MRRALLPARRNRQASTCADALKSDLETTDQTLQVHTKARQFDA